MKNKNRVLYRAYVNNESGAGEQAGEDTNLNNLKAYVRSRYGAGWTVTIEKFESDGDSIMEFPPVEVAKFTLRK
jgi:hypothetical protein